MYEKPVFVKIRVTTRQAAPSQIHSSKDIPALREEHGECVAAELGLGRGENLGFVEGIRLGMPEEMAQLDVVEVVHVEEVEVVHLEEITTFFSTTTFAVAAVEDRHLEVGIRDDIFLLNGTSLISFAAEGDAVHLEVLEDV